MKEFYARLLVRGYQRYLLIPTFSKVITGARAFPKRVSVQRCVSDQDKDKQGHVFFHLTYHPGPHLKESPAPMAPTTTSPAMGASPTEAKKQTKIPIGIKSMCVAYSRPKNLGNIFTYHKVDRLDGPPVSSYLE